jgi:hypothetical protein
MPHAMHVPASRHPRAFKVAHEAAFGGQTSPSVVVLEAYRHPLPNGVA